MKEFYSAFSALGDPCIQMGTDLELGNDVQAIVSCLFAICQQVDVDYFSMAFISPTSLQRPDVQFLSNCPDRWKDIYCEKGMFAVDPLFIKGMSQSTPFLWAHVISECREKSNLAGLEVMMQARDAGLHDGVTIPWHGPNGHIGLLSLMTQTLRTELQWFNTIVVSSWLSSCMFETMIRSNCSSCTYSARLSVRELEVCHWAAEGKQNGDIARILGVTPRTVSFHLERIVEKLGASSKNQAISKAIKQGLIKLNIASARVKNIVIG